MGLYKLCQHKGRERDRCDHGWWGGFRGVRVSLGKWSNREIRSKSEAAAILDELRTAIREGTFDARGQAPVATTNMTFCELAALYKERHVIANGLALAKDFDWSVRPYIERFGDWPLTDIKTSDVDDFIADLRKPRIIGGRPDPRLLTPGAINRIVDLLRHMLNWAVGREYLERTPFKRGNVTLIKKLPDDSRRTRRISEEEEAALIAAAPVHLRAMFIAALDTGMRRGEMLALRFADIDLERGLITLRAETTKSKRTRHVPIATERLQRVLEWLRLDAGGEPKPDQALVFSDETGQRLPLFHQAWVLTVLRAHGIKPKWSRRLNYKALSRESQDAFRQINLRWHDLRHEYASRLVELGVPLSQVRDLLGHASIVTTERYETMTLRSLQVAAAKLERGCGFDATDGRQAPASSRPDVRLKPDATANEAAPEFRQESVKSRAETGQSRTRSQSLAIEPNELENLNLQNWLGRRDSNPNNRVQSAVSYR
jgi:integrase